MSCHDCMGSAVTKQADLPRLPINALPNWDKRALLLRQFPKHARKLLDFDVRRWKDEMWVAVYKYVVGPPQMPTPPWAGRHYAMERELLASAKLLSKPRRFDNQMVEWATLDPELIAFTLLRL
jgi:hypothetical protein